MLDLVLSVLADTKALYQQAGVPVAPKHEQIAIQMLVGHPHPERLPAYVRHQFVARIWRDKAHTKSLLNLLRDGDWDVEFSAATRVICEACLNTGMVVTNGLDVLDPAAKLGRCTCGL